jgi:hypothetical protein
VAVFGLGPNVDLHVGSMAADPADTRAPPHPRIARQISARK